MKKTVALLLGLMLVLGFALVSCGEEATEDDATATTAEATGTTVADETESSAADAAATGAVDWTQAVDYEGQETTITGPVVEISNLFEEKGIAKVLIRLGGNSESDHFNAVVVLNADGTFPAYAAEYQSMMGALVGQTVEVTGVVSLNSFESCFEILLNDANNDTLPDDAMSGTLVLVQ